jgi:hypothetical protein
MLHIYQAAQERGRIVLAGGMDEAASESCARTLAQLGYTVVADHLHVPNNFLFYSGQSSVDPRPVIAEKLNRMWDIPGFENARGLVCCVTAHLGIRDIRDIVSRPDQLIDAVASTVAAVKGGAKLNVFATQATNEWLGGMDAFNIVEGERNAMQESIWAVKADNAQAFTPWMREFAARGPWGAFCTEGPVLAQAAGISNYVDPMVVSVVA